MAESNPTLLKIMARWLGIAFVIFILIILGGAYLTLQVLPKVYTATAEILIHPGIGHAWMVDAAHPSPTSHEEIDAMESPAVLLPIITDLNLDQIWAKRFHQRNGEKLSTLEVMAYMKKILRIDRIPGTNIDRITVASEVPKEAADIANAVADKYKTMRQAQEDQRNIRGEESLREQIDQQQKVIREKRAAWTSRATIWLGLLFSPPP